jgi:long-subunit acyl-CoA synthetase (AMP-forming)
MRDGAVPGYERIESSVGLLLSSMEARIIREDGADGGVGESGELWVRGGSIFLGYLNDEEATAKAFAEDGWLKTGDIFKVDEKQNF